MSDAVEFELGETVYHRCSPTDKGMVTGIVFRPGFHTFYVTWENMDERSHYAIELTRDRNFAEVADEK